MALFAYTGRMEDGAPIKATVEASSRYEALSSLRERGITEALTGDRHFEQAGFVALLK